MGGTDRCPAMCLTLHTLGDCLTQRERLWRAALLLVTEGGCLIWLVHRQRSRTAATWPVIGSSSRRGAPTESRGIIVSHLHQAMQVPLVMSSRRPAFQPSDSHQAIPLLTPETSAAA